MFLIFFLFLDTLDVKGTFDADLLINTPSLYSLDLGYGNPSLANGLNGFTLNPAGLAEIKDREFTTAFSIASKSDFNLPFIFEPTENEEIKIDIPCHFSFGQPTEINTIAIGIPTFLGNFGIGLIDGFGVGGKLQGNGSISYTLNDTIKDTLRTTEISELFEDIPIEWVFSIPFEALMIGDASFNLSTKKFFVGLARKMGPFNSGLGIAYRSIRGKGSVNAKIHSDVPCTLECNALHGTGWTVEAVGNTRIIENILINKGEITLTGNEFTMTGGTQLKLGPIMLGSSLSFVPATNLTIRGFNNVTYINGIPTISIDTFYLEVDTANKVVIGDIGVQLSDFPDTTETNNLSEKYRLSSNVELQLGGGIKLGPITTGLGIGLSLPSMNFYSNCGLEIKIIIPLRASIEIRSEAFQTEEGNEFIFIPYYTINLGTSIPIGPVTTNLGIRTNFFSNLISNLEIEKKGVPEFIFSPVIGLYLQF